MKRLVVLIAAVLAGLFFSSLTYAQNEGLLSETGIAAGGEVAFYSEYLWRGFLLDGDPVLQPGWYFTGPDWKVGKLTAKLWTSHDLSGSDPRVSEEYDYILDYTYTRNGMSFSAGHTYYDFPQADSFSREWYAGVAFPGVFLSPSIFIYRDYAGQEDGGGMGTYTVINAAKSIPVSLGTLPASVELSGHYGYNHELFIRGKGSDIALTVGLRLPLTRNIWLMPTINCSFPFGDLASGSDGNQEHRVYTGVTVQYSM